MARSKSQIHGIEVEGVKELRAQLKRVEKMPKRSLSKAAREGMRKPLADARKNAPRKTGTLKKGIKSVMEKATKRMKYKTVYRLVFDPKLTDVFKGKKIIRPGLYGASPPRKHGYYPLSMEYGFKTAKGKFKGLEFAKDAIENNQKDSLQKVIDTLDREVQTLINKK